MPTATTYNETSRKETETETDYRLKISEIYIKPIN
jgi:hypothetical protein